MDVVVEDGGEEGAGEEDDEEGGDGGVIDVVIFLDLGTSVIVRDRWVVKAVSYIGEKSL